MLEFEIIIDDKVKAKIDADNQEDALNLFFEACELDNSFLEYVHCKKFSGGLAELFYRDVNGHFENQTGANLSKEYVKKCFEDNVVRFFADNHNYAVLYIAYFYDSYKKYPNFKLPKNLVGYAYKKILKPTIKAVSVK